MASRSTTSFPKTEPIEITLNTSWFSFHKCILCIYELHSSIKFFPGCCWTDAANIAERQHCTGGRNNLTWTLSLNCRWCKNVEAKTLKINGKCLLSTFRNFHWFPSKFLEFSGFQRKIVLRSKLIYFWLKRSNISKSIFKHLLCTQRAKLCEYEPFIIPPINELFQSLFGTRIKPPVKVLVVFVHHCSHTQIIHIENQI